MSQPLVSVIMPAYNAERYVRASVDSILAQTFTDFEFIAIDDGSTDATGAILAAYAAQDSRLVLLRPANQGVGRALNLGLSRARGRYMARQDADDRSHPERLARQVAWLEANPAIGVLGTQASLIDGDGRAFGQTEFPTAPADVQATLLRDCCLLHGSVMVRTSSLQAVGHYDIRLPEAEDYDLWLRLGEVTQLANLAEPLYSFRFHANSQSHRGRPMMMYCKAQALEHALERRYGAVAPAAHRAAAARDYLEALVTGVINNQADLAQRSLDQALRLVPALFAHDEPLENLLNTYTAAGDATTGARVVEAVFAALPATPARLARQKSRYVAALHMRDVFRDLGQHRPAQIRRNLWLGIRHDPRWLLNRGVVATCLRGLTGRL